MNVVDLKKDEPVGDLFAIGAVVQLKSGGWSMTVRSATKTKSAVMVKVDWLDAAGNNCQFDYDARQLQASLGEEETSSDD